MSAQETATLARRWYEEYAEEKDLSLVDKYLAPDFANHTPLPGIPNDREGYKQLLSMYTEALPDFEVIVEDVVAEEDKAAVRWRVKATHTGPLMGVPPSGNEVDITGAGIVHVRDGKIVAQWEIADLLGMMQQIGAAPEPDAA